MCNTTTTTNPNHTPKTIQVWTHSARVYLYEQLVERLGMVWSVDKWEVTGMRPSNLSAGAFDAVFVEIYNEMANTGFKMFPNKTPKSHKALKQQFQWCITTQPNMDSAQRKNQRRNLIAAYEAGFISMVEIYHLEILQAAK